MENQTNIGIERNVLDKYDLNKAGYYDKVIQAYIDNQPIVRFVNIEEEEFHSVGLAHMLEENGLEFGIDKEIKKKTGENLPSRFGNRYRVVGMGFVRNKPREKQAYFYGDSTGYEIGINLEHLDLIRRQYPDWKITDDIPRNDEE